MTESIHIRVKNMPNPSPGLLSILRRNPHSGIWAIGNENDTSVSIKKQSMHKVSLRLGSPEAIKMVKPSQKAVRARCFSGITNLRSSMFSGFRSQHGYSIGLGKKGVGVWMVDISDTVVEGLNLIGACFISPNHCEFEQASPRIRQCKFCRRKLYKKIVISRGVDWITKDKK